MVERTPSISS